MTGWTKLHSRIVVSSIWQQPDHVRILWVTMLAMADADGIVEGSVCGLAKMAKLTPEKTQEALDALMAPDPDSSDRTSGATGRAESAFWRPQAAGSSSTTPTTATGRRSSSGRPPSVSDGTASASGSPILPALHPNL
jgi:hypothetical protein